MKLKHIIMLGLFIGLAFFYFMVNPSGVDYLPKCPLYTTTGIYCPGCGSQRATHDLLHLDFKGLVHHNLLYLLALILLFYHGVILFANKFLNKNWQSILNHPKTPMLVLVIIILFWIFRNLPFAPFNSLAPAL